jgi:hypothetical protein
LLSPLETPKGTFFGMQRVREKMKKYLYLFVFIFIALFANLDRAPFFRPGGFDQQGFQYTGMLITQGYAPYINAVDNKPPLIFFVEALTHYFFPWGEWIFERLLVGIGAWCLYVFLIRKKSSFALLMGLVFILLSNLQSVAPSSGHIRVMTSILTLFLFTYTGSSSKQKDYVYGIILGLIFWLLQSEILMPLVLLFFADRNAIKDFTRLRKIISGSLIVTLPIIIYLAAHGALYEAYHQAFGLNFIYVADGGSFLNRFALLYKMLYARGLIPITIFALLGIPSIKDCKFFSYPKITLAFLLMTAFSSVLISGHAFSHHLQPFICALTICLTLIFVEFESRLSHLKAALVAVGFLLTLLPWESILQPLYESFNTAGKMFYAGNFPRKPPFLDQYLLSLKNKPGSLYILDPTARILYINTQYEIKAPTRFHFYDLLSPLMERRDIENEIFQDVSARKPEVIIARDPLPVLNDMISKWNTFLYAEYEKKSRYKSNYFIYLRKSAVG